MTVLLPPKQTSNQANQKTPPKEVTRLEIIAMGGTILCTALSVLILVSRLLGVNI